MEITKLVKCVHRSKMTIFFCSIKLLTNSTFYPRKYNPGELDSKEPDHACSKSHTYISEIVMNNKHVFYVIAY